MRCPFCAQNIRVQGRFCPKCGEQIFGLPVDRPRPQTPAAPSPGPRPAPTPRIPAPGPTHAPPPESEYIEISLDDDGPPAGGRSRPPQPAEVGKNCPFCRFPIKPGEQVFACPACKVIHHDECWQENEGCTTYGCRGAVVAATPAAPMSPQGQYAPTGGGGHPSVQVPEAVAQGMRLNDLSARATNALWLSILGLLCGCLPALIGMMMGISVLGELKTVRMLPGANTAQGRAVAAVIIGAVLSLAWLLWLIASSLGA